MKKILSIVLVLCMLFTGCFMLFSCSDPENTGDNGDGNKKLTVEDLQNNPGLVAAGLTKAFSAFFDVAGVNSVIGNMNKGSVALVVDNEMLKEEIGLGKTQMTVYADTQDNLLNKLVLDLQVALGEENLGGVIYIDKDGIAASGESIFGSDDAYKVDIPNIVANFKDSALAQMAGGEEAVNALLPTFEMLVKAWELPFAETAKDSEDYAELVAWNNEALKKLNPVVKAETVNGVEALTLTYEFTNETIEAYFTYVAENLPDLFVDVYGNFASVMDLPEFSEETVGQGKDMIINYMNQYVVIDLDLSASIAQDGGALVNEAIKGTVAPSEELKTAEGVDGSATIDVSVNASATAITMNMAVNAEVTESDETMEIEASAAINLTKEEKDGNVIIKGDVDVISVAPEAMELNDVLVLSATYDKADGDLEVKADVNLEEYVGQKISAELKGNIGIKDGKVTVAINSVGAASGSTGVTLSDLGVSIVVDPTATVPAVSADAKEIMSLTAEDWQALIESISDSPLVGLIGSIGAEDSPAFRVGSYTSDAGLTYTFYEDGTFDCEMVVLEAVITASGEYVYDGGKVNMQLPVGDSEYRGMFAEYYGDVIVIDGISFYYEY
ncbi:MAG: hypothetical protein IJX80_06035 [Clostridia bacterium]|nr:hypothetical protein [Clostridia bacterium]